MADPESWAKYPEELKRKWRENYRIMREEILEASLPEDEARELAQKYIDEGYHQCSRKHRLISNTYNYSDYKSKVKLDLRTFEIFRELFKEKYGAIWKMVILNDIL